MRHVGIIMRRELGSYFATPLAYVFSPRRALAERRE